jgi:hypothetical protein
MTPEMEFDTTKPVAEMKAKKGADNLTTKFADFFRTAAAHRK